MGAIWEASKLGGLNIKKCLQPRKLTHEKSRSWNEAGSQPVLPGGMADDVGEVNRCVHPMGPPRELRLKPGQTAAALIKATEVMIIRV